MFGRSIAVLFACGFSGAAGAVAMGPQAPGTVAGTLTLMVCAMASALITVCMPDDMGKLT